MEKFPSSLSASGRGGFGGPHFSRGCLLFIFSLHNVPHLFYHFNPKLTTYFPSALEIMQSVSHICPHSPRLSHMISIFPIPIDCIILPLLVEFHWRERKVQGLRVKSGASLRMMKPKTPLLSMFLTRSVIQLPNRIVPE